MKVILVIDVDNIDIENTKATYIELQCNNQTKQISLINHWLKPMPQKKTTDSRKMATIEEIWWNGGYNTCIEEILGGTE